MLPLLAGLAGSAFGLSAMNAALLGAGIGLLSNKEDPIGGAISGGLGGYGGASLGGTLGKMGAATTAPATTLADTAASTLSSNAATEGAKAFLTSEAPAIGSAQFWQGAPTMAQPVAEASSLPNPLLQTAATTPTTGLGTMGAGIKDLMSEGGFGRFKTAMGTDGTPATTGQAAMALGMPALTIGSTLASAFEPEYEEFEEEDKYKKDGGLYLFGPKSTQSGLTLNYANGGTVQQGGLMDLHGANDSQYGPPLSEQGYGLGRLNNLASQESQARAEMGMYAKGGDLEDGGFVIPADVVSHLGNGSTDAGLAVLAKKYGAKPIKGDGDGMSDSIPTTIEGREKARVADGEAYIPKDVVRKLGGPEKLYAMMDRVRKARTGTAKQGKEINPHRVA